MEKIDIKFYLRQIARREALIDVKQEQLKRLRNRVEFCQSFQYDRVSVQGTKRADTIGDAIASIEKLELDISSEIMALNKYQEEARQLIGRLNSAMQQAVLFKRYFEGKSFNRIADEVCYSLRQVHRIHGNALSELRKMVD